MGNDGWKVTTTRGATDYAATSSKVCRKGSQYVRVERTVPRQGGQSFVDAAVDPGKSSYADFRARLDSSKRIASMDISGEKPGRQLKGTSLYSGPTAYQESLATQQSLLKNARPALSVWDSDRFGEEPGDIEPRQLFVEAKARPGRDEVGAWNFLAAGDRAVTHKFTPNEELRPALNAAQAVVDSQDQDCDQLYEGVRAAFDALP